MIANAETMEILRKNLCRFRGDMSYSELARRCCTKDWKCYPATIEQIEKGRHVPNVILTARICEVLGVTVDDLLSRRRRRIAS